MSSRASKPWRAGHDLLRSRVESIPDQLRAASRSPSQPLPEPALGARCCVLTGVGSSAGHARLLAHVLASVGLPARFESTGALALGAPPGSDQDLLIVFSQGLSPNARFAFRHAKCFRACILVTAEASAGSERAGALEQLSRRGVFLWRTGGAPEFGLLLRVVGPALAILAALRLAAALRPESSRLRPLGEAEIVDTTERLARRIEAVARLAAAAEPEQALRFERAPVLLATGGSGPLLENARLKLVEGLLLDPPPVQDLLEFAHGGFQQSLAAGARDFWCFEHAELPPGAPAFEALRGCLDPKLQRISRVRSQLPGFLSIFEHEAWVDAFVLQGVEARGLDLAEWPGKGLDGALYDLAPESLALPGAPIPAPGSVLERALWPEIDARLRRRQSLALVPLGSTEQHGAHLAFGTDTRIAQALAQRLAAQLPHAVALPAIPLGCAAEHLDFRGTLSISEATLEKIVEELIENLSGHGFAEAMVFSAHGGNTAALRSGEARLIERARGAGIRLLVVHDLGHLTERLHAIAAAEGIASQRAGHHAGESETSMLLRIEPSWVRTSAFAQGHVELELDPQALFYPSLRTRVPSGVVGDPRGARAERGERYLEAWVDVLLAAYRDWKKRTQTKGIQKP